MNACRRAGSPPGIGVKRWLLVVFVGRARSPSASPTCCASSTRDVEPGEPPASARRRRHAPVAAVRAAGLIAGVVGVGAVRLRRLSRRPRADGPVRAWDGDQPLVEVIYQKRFLARGPRIVAIGGGTGLSTLLRGLKEHTSNLTAVVTVADDGGSSGVLREELGIPAGRRHPQLHRRPRRRRAADGPAAPVPVPGRPDRPRLADERPAGSAATPSATCSSRR